MTRLRSDRPRLRTVLGDGVKDHLLESILAGRYAPGARIVETRVARELGVSQSPVREALRDLVALGVVEMPAFRGARVRRPSFAELLDGFVVRTELELLAARLALPRLGAQELDGLQRLLDRMRQAARSGALHDEAVADAEFHGRIVELSGNAVLQRVWRTTEPLLRTYITISARGGDPAYVADLHRPLLDALRSRELCAVEAALRNHFADAAALLARTWPHQDPTPARSTDRALPPGRRAG